MAELVVRAHYASPPRKMALSALRLLFPLWGVAAPITFAICAAVLLTCLYSLGTSFVPASLPMQLFGVVIACAAIPLAGLFLSRLLSRDSLVIDRDGLQLPFSVLNLFGCELYAPWQSVSSITVLGEGGKKPDGWRNKKLLLLLGKPHAHTDGAGESVVSNAAAGKRKIVVELKRMKPEEIEQMLLAIEMWGGQCGRDQSLDELKDSLKVANTETAGLSYTDLWEDELRRRFCSTAFIPLEPGRLLKDGRLRVVRQVAMGGLSAVYLCQLDGKQLVILKEAVVPDDTVEHIRQKALEMFRREADILMKLDHPHIVKVKEHFVETGRNYLMLEYINGQDIRQYVRQNGAQREVTVVDWAVQICGIIKYLHEQDPPVIHRDLTPDNLVVREDGSVVLIDFGAANELLSNATGTFVGKQSFIAPEQFRGKAVVQSDLYALGGTLYYALVGEEPEALSTSNPRDKNPSVSEELAELVVCCTEMEPADRYQSAAQLLPVLRKIAAAQLAI